MFQNIVESDDHIMRIDEPSLILFHQCSCRPYDDDILTFQKMFKAGVFIELTEPTKED